MRLLKECKSLLRALYGSRATGQTTLIRQAASLSDRPVFILASTKCVAENLCKDILMAEPLILSQNVVGKRMPILVDGSFLLSFVADVHKELEKALEDKVLLRKIKWLMKTMKD